MRMTTLAFVRPGFLLPIALALGWLGGQPLRGAIITLETADDTALFERSPDNNLGGMLFMPIGTTSLGTLARGMVRFDVAGALPSDAVIKSASLRVKVVSSPSISLNTYRL